MSFFDYSFELQLPAGSQSTEADHFDPGWYEPGGPLSLSDTPEFVHTPSMGSGERLIVVLHISPSRLASATSHGSSIGDKEMRAKKVISKQKKEDGVAEKMGSDVRIISTATGYHIGGVYWQAPACDTTIPSSPAEISEYVDMLVKAILNNQGCRERENRQQFLNRWGTGSSFYTIFEVEAAAREVILGMKEIHENGWTKAIYDKDERECYQQTMFYSFADRFTAIHELLMHSKTTCKDVMKGTKFYAIIGNPRVLSKRTKMNVHSNSRKAVRIAKGMEFMKRQHEDTAKNEYDAAEEAAEDDHPRPKKRAKKRHFR
ncbi:hypothetical protein PtrSN002B_005920 [Pyrenophora tritici-repentis]|nr:hypothetical protein PtrV1_05885 [Pyrenophora tritici-repentis]KAG9381165.1 hypothetical protein A1F94_008485 [Pyrenophora tritici-repentis]KAI0581875.1 hypothetical protein Alg130_06398 [Pyrenophora tritici-repentis]KAI0583855.1 hypothetical protein Alg215_03383 [Pyrenophora tritici-repentis]KAI0608581.1 hypothetical protein TUN205_07185 [Pyrenophora tritici-repentis]